MALLCIGCALGLIFSSLALYVSGTHNATNVTNNYGSMLAKATAARSSDAAFHQDLIGMRAVLQDATEYSNVRIATVHDVENKLLVQAGDFPYFKHKDDQSFTSPITQHDNIAGYVTVIIAAPSIFPLEILTLIYALIAFTSISVVILLSRSGCISCHWSKEQVKESLHAKFSSYIPPELSSPNTSHTYPVTTFSAFTLIHIKNIQTIKQQLNGENFRNTLKIMDDIVEDVMSLYGGIEFQWNMDHYKLTLNSRESQSEAIFHAICCAYLISEIASTINNIPLDIATLVSLNEQHNNDMLLPRAKLAITSEAAAESSLNARLKLTENNTEKGQKLVSEFVQPYKGLLDNQRAQLLD